VHRNSPQAETEPGSIEQESQKPKRCQTDASRDEQIDAEIDAGEPQDGGVDAKQRPIRVAWRPYGRWRTQGSYQGVAEKQAETKRHEQRKLVRALCRAVLDGFEQESSDDGPEGEGCQRNDGRDENGIPVEEAEQDESQDSAEHD